MCTTIACTSVPYPYGPMFAVPLAGRAALRRTVPAWLRITSALVFYRLRNTPTHHPRP